MISDLEAAWRELDAVTPKGWYVGRPRKHDKMAGNQWEQYVFDPG